MSPLLEKGYLGSQEDQLLVKIHFLTVVFQKGILFTQRRGLLELRIENVILL